MCHEMKKIDGDMQSLVYENYNKFINATDTIRSMKTNVEDMESEVEALLSNMESITSVSDAIGTNLAGRRSKIEQVIGVRRLLGKLEFLFELPMRYIYIFIN